METVQPGRYKEFLALIIVMSVDVKTRIEDYWSKSWPFATKSFPSVMSQNRFHGELAGTF